MQNPIITLTTDWRNNDFYLGALRGRLLSLCPDALLAEISHMVEAFNIIQGSFILRNSFSHFPKGTIHIMAVNSEPAKGKKHLVGEYDGHFFIGADNGMYSLMFDDAMIKVHELSTTSGAQNSFSALTILAEAAANLANGKHIEELGPVCNDFTRHVLFRPTVEERSISGSIIYIDSYKNAITNISKDLFERIRNGRKYDIFIQSNKYRVNNISEGYHDVPVGELLVLFNSIGLLEIAINNGNASELLNLHVNSALLIKFHE